MSEKSGHNGEPFWDNGKLPDWAREKDTVDAELNWLAATKIPPRETPPDEIALSGEVSGFLEQCMKKGILDVRMTLHEVLQILHSPSAYLESVKSEYRRQELSPIFDAIYLLQDFINREILFDGMQLDEVLGTLIDWREGQRKKAENPPDYDDGPRDIGNLME